VLMQPGVALFCNLGSAQPHLSVFLQGPMSYHGVWFSLGGIRGKEVQAQWHKHLKLLCMAYSVVPLTNACHTAKPELKGRELP
jgi:hypothetical protein